MSAQAPAASLERQWWLRLFAVFQSPSSVFAWLRDDSDEQAGARQEPILALVLLAGIAANLSTNATGTLLDDPAIDGLLVAVLAFLAGSLYGAASYWIGGAAVYFGARAAGGQGSYRRARHVLAYAAAPVALSLFVVWPLRLALYGSDAFRSGGADAGAGTWAFAALEGAFFLWAFGLLVLGLSVVHGWSLVRSLGALALAALALLIFGLLFALI